MSHFVPPDIDKAHDYLRGLRYEVAESLCLKIEGLERAAFSYVIDAFHFFQGARLPYSWPRLRSLALTTKHFRKSDPGEKETRQIEKQLVTAAKTALCMPRLKTIWYGAAGNACAFIYRVDAPITSIKWRGT